MARLAILKRRRRSTSPKKALDRLSESKIRGKRAISASGAVAGGTAGVALFACTPGIVVSGFIGLLAGKIASLKVEKMVSRRALRKRLEAVVGRPRLASRLAERYAAFPAYQRAILELGGVKLEGKTKKRKEQRKRFAADRMEKEDIEKYFKDWITEGKSLKAILK